MRAPPVLLAFLCGIATPGVFAAERFSGFNNTTSTAFTGVYLAPRGATDWGPNQALNDKDKIWDFGERLTIRSMSRGIFDLKLIDRSGRICVKHGIDLTRDTTFDIRDDDLRDCKN